jgi:hypothetical protein
LPFPADEAQAWLTHYRALFNELQRDHGVDPRALRAYISLHADAARVVDMAYPNPCVPDHIRHSNLRALDQILLDDLLAATDASPTITPAPSRVPGPRRGFPPLADSQPSVNKQEPVSHRTPTIPSQPANPNTARRHQ